MHSPTYILVLGRPGSGKTTAAISIMDHLRAYPARPVGHFTDYDDLLALARTEGESRFMIHDRGFDVLDTSVYREALTLLEQRVETFVRTNAPASSVCVIADFARDNYAEALRDTSSELWDRSHVLFINADPETCLHRIGRRVGFGGHDNHGWSEHIMADQFGFDNAPYFERLAAQHKISPASRVIRVVHNGKGYDGPEGLTRLQLEARDFADHAIVAASVPAVPWKPPKAETVKGLD